MNSVIKFKNNKEKKLVPFYSNSKLETIIHVDMDSIFESIYGVIIAKRKKHWAEGSGWTIDRTKVIEQNIKASRYKPLSSSNLLNYLKN